MLTNEMLLENIAKCVDRPVSEVFVPGFQFCDYRLSYGVACYEPSTVYFLAIYPAFCLNAKAVFHYNDLTILQQDINNILVDRSRAEGREVREVRDVIAAVFAISRKKESIELFQEQRDFIDLGVKHIHLDNYYQDDIKNLCTQYYVDGTVCGKPLNLSFLSK